ncbi:TPA: hypothetical protein ACQVQ7_005541 [Serratia marcescens]|nr:hypothetical protein [Serratia nevei]MEC5616472.1 hypothetical protein [Serratia nevei]
MPRQHKAIVLVLVAHMVRAVLARYLNQTLGASSLVVEVVTELSS